MNVVGTTYLSGCNYQVGYDLLGRNTPGNYSTVRFYGVLNVTNNYISWSRGTASVWNASSGLNTRYSKGSHIVVQQDVNLYHDDNGNYSATLSGTLNTTYVSGTASGNFSLPKINRYPVLQSGQNFTDEENPTINFTSYGTFPLRAKLEAGGNTQLIIRDLPSKTATSYTFELTDEEREKLRKLIPTSNSLQVTETICAMSGNTELSASASIYTMTLVNGNPVFSNFEFEDVNEKTVALTGNNKINVNGYSNIKITVPVANKAIAQKNATMVKYQLQVLNNDVLEIPYSDTEEVSGTMIGSNQGIYNLYALDSRNNSTQVTKLATKSISYSPLIINQVQAKAIRDESGVGKNCTISFDGTFWNDTFGEVTNTIDGFEYWFKKTENSEWIKGTTKLTPTVNGNNFTFNGSIRSNNADYSWDLESTYNIKIKISDKLSSGEVNIVLNSGRPNLAIAKNGIGINTGFNNNIEADLQVANEICILNGGNKIFVKDLLKNSKTKVLFSSESNTGDTSATITLNDSVENYDYITVIGVNYKQCSCTIRITGAGAYTCQLIGSTWADTIYFRFAHYQLSQKTMTRQGAKLVYIYGGAVGQRDDIDARILMVLGHKV